MQDDTVRRPRIDLVIGTRPNIVKAAPLLRALDGSGWSDPRLVFLMQHTDDALAKEPLEDLGIHRDRPIYIPLVARGLGKRLGEMIEGYGAQLDAERPDLVVVFGDVDTTLAATYAAKRAGLTVAHIEAGLRSRDRAMPEELNRLMVDSISDLFFATSDDAVRTLVDVEGHMTGSVHHVGNLMIDSLLVTADAERGRNICSSLGVEPGAFALATFHRPSNVDTRDALEGLAAALARCTAILPTVFPVHPRTRNAMDQHGLTGTFSSIPRLRLIPPLSYAAFVSLLGQSRAVLTDSGGIQEEASCLGIPCLTMRENTERPVTVSQGSNQLVSSAQLAAALGRLVDAPMPQPARIPFWDGRTAARIDAALHDWWQAEAAP